MDLLEKVVGWLVKGLKHRQKLVSVNIQYVRTTLFGRIGRKPMNCKEARAEARRCGVKGQWKQLVLLVKEQTELIEIVHAARVTFEEAEAYLFDAEFNLAAEWAAFLAQYPTGWTPAGMSRLHAEAWAIELDRCHIRALRLESIRICAAVAALEAAELLAKAPAAEVKVVDEESKA